jgi:voltage-gated potassium channel
MSLTRIINDTDTPAGKSFDIFVLVLILYSIITFSVETLPNLTDGTRGFLEASELVVTIFFSLEYIFRLLTAPSKLRYFVSFYGLIDLIAILPFYLALGIDARSIKAFRLFRIFRVLKLTRYSIALRRLGKAFDLVKAEALLFGIATAIMLYLAAVGIYYFENAAQPENFQSIFHSLWWATTTLTTVGYGDVYPITVGGKVFTFLVLMVGLGVVAVPAGLLASALSTVRKQEEAEDH